MAHLRVQHLPLPRIVRLSSPSGSWNLSHSPSLSLSLFYVSLDDVCLPFEIGRIAMYGDLRKMVGDLKGEHFPSPCDWIDSFISLLLSISLSLLIFPTIRGNRIVRYPWINGCSFVAKVSVFVLVLYDWVILLAYKVVYLVGSIIICFNISEKDYSSFLFDRFIWCFEK